MARFEEAEIRSRMRKSRDDVPFTREEFAPLLGVSKATLENYEGKRQDAGRVPLHILPQWADLTNTSLKWLLWGDEDESAQVLDRLDRFEAQQTELANQIGALREQQGVLTQLDRDLLAEVSAALNRLGRDVGRGRPRQRSGQKTLPAATEPAA